MFWRAEGGLHTGAAVSLGVGTFLACALISGLSFATNKFVAKRIAEKRAATAAAPHCSVRLIADLQVDLNVDSWRDWDLCNCQQSPHRSHSAVVQCAHLFQ